MVVVVDTPGTEVGVVVGAVVVVVVLDCAPAGVTKRDDKAAPAAIAARSPRRGCQNRYHLRPILAPGSVKESLEL